METSEPKKLPAFIIESTQRSFMLAWISITNAFTGSKYVLVLEKGRFVKKIPDTQRTHPTSVHSSQRLAMASTKM